MIDKGVNSQHFRRSPPDQALARLAARQHGVVTTRQLREVGLDAGSIAYRRRSGRLHPLHRGVYAVGHPRLSWEGRQLAAALAAGPDAVLSHSSAAALWRLIGRREGPVDVTVPGRLRSREGIRVHTTRDLHPRDRTRNAGIPVTTVARTLRDLAEVAPEKTLRRAVSEAYVQRRVDEDRLRQQCEAAPGHRGAARLRALLGPRLAPTRSELEDRVLRLLLDHGLPRPRVNTVIEGLEVDFLYARQRLVIEADGRRYHGHRLARRSDAARQATLAVAGYRVLRVGWTEVTRRPGEAADRVREALAAGQPRAAISRSGADGSPAGGGLGTSPTAGA